MDERSGIVRLVDSAGDFETGGVVATVSRAEVEEAARADEGPVDLLLDVERVAADGEGREMQRVALAWEPADLEQLLDSTSGDQIPLTFDEAELQRLLAEDVEAHGLRERAAVLSVVAGLAAAGAGSAFARPALDGGGGGGATVAAATAQAPSSEMSTGLGAQQEATSPGRASEMSTGLGAQQAAPAQAERAAAASEVSTGLGAQPATPEQTGRAAAPSEISTGIVGTTPATPSEISTGVVQEPPVTPSEISTGITSHPTATPVSVDNPSWSPSVTEGALVAGMILALTAAGFVARGQRRPPATA